ncbi:acyl oxidase [Fusarium tjaetaba]|uniref:Acyl oxidase n=1 Tax=Fusarium tjaetaba TaxID=1567544 RepID=A0A8H5W7T9_9HYPO|nr:acyl oxidase [Fusarium tjaetaba]KAF5648438.1 acyl oxidase [Fusarium tjaetaba]
MRMFKEIISGLDEVWLVYIQASIRGMIGGETERSTIRKRFFERSFPIHATPHSFDRIGPDPRTVEDDLSHLHVRNPKRLYDSWLQALEKIEVRPREERYRILLGFNPRRSICNLRDAEDWLQSENSGWTTKSESTWSSQEPKIEGVAASETPESRDEDIGKAVRPAFGFWLFPVDAFCDANKTSESEGYFTTFDVRKYRPELALRRLNEGDLGRNVSKEVDAHHEVAIERRYLYRGQTSNNPVEPILPYRRRAYGPSLTLEDA